MSQPRSTVGSKFCLAVFHDAIWLIVIAGLISLQPVAIVQAQSPAQPQQFREAVTLELDSTIERRFETVRQHVAAEQWDDALRFLSDIREQFGSQLVKIDEGRYVSVKQHCTESLRQLPPAGLAAYRESVDAEAARWFESAKSSRDVQQMRRVVTQTPLSRYESQALSLLAEWEWQRGRPAAAWHYWHQLTLDANPIGEVPSQPELFARLQLCDLALHLDRGLTSGQNPSSTTKKPPPLTPEQLSARGMLAGEHGSLSEIVARQTEDQRWQQPFVTAGNDHLSFAGTPNRTHIAPPVEQIRKSSWFKTFTADRLSRIVDDRIHPAFALQNEPNVFPVSRGDLLFFNDPSNIYAIRLADGEPAWSPDGVIFRMNAVAPRYPISGPTGYSMSIDTSGRLFARMGSPVTVRSARELTALRSEIVCLDIATGEGRELWRVDDSTLGVNTAFDGAPVCDGDRVYTVATQSGGRTELFVLCFDATTGTQLWRQPVCTVLRQVSTNANEVSHSLLTVSADHLVFSTNQGAIAALDKDNGTINWVTTYDSDAAGPSPPNPAIIHANTAYAAPSDSDRVLAIDLWSGATVWSQVVPDRIRHLIGIAGGRLFASGRSLWSINALTGTVIWGTPTYDPQSFGFGRAILAGDKIYWPKRSAIEIRSQRTGRMVNRPVNLRAMGISGGNLLGIQGRLLVSGSGSLSLLGNGQARSEHHTGENTQPTPVVFEKWWH